MNSNDLLVEYVKKIVKPLVGDPNVCSITIAALRQAGFSVSAICQIKGFGHSGDVWEKPPGLAVQLGKDRPKVYRNSKYSVINTVNLTLVNEGPFNAWCRKVIIDEFLQDL